ncbi:hypothetical protein SAMN00808754_1580 [Thermanaeromonas toyohensis ToBE]|uniref:Uncharacterized protein n=1 Tax=Thermanaeromonas toyohensis ToBE TaxID=698762 RepID=A0A1W1VTH9_9FIRM|nr:hypothetical protein SAMN00808754_1580 [Thermanaeromonas toyohensis ToBE]
MARKFGVGVLALLLLLALAWPAVADTVTVTVTPLDPSAAFAIDTSSPPPSNLNIIKGSSGSFNVTLKNVAAEPLYLYARTPGQATPVNPSDTPWSLTTDSTPSGNSYSLWATTGSLGGYISIVGTKVSSSSVDSGSTIQVVVKVNLGGVVGGPQKISIEFYGSRS